MFYHRYKKYKDNESRKSQAILNKVKGVSFLDEKEENVKDALDYFKLQLCKNNVPDCPTFQQYEKVYLTLSFDLLKQVHAA